MRAAVLRDWSYDARGIRKIASSRFENCFRQPVRRPSDKSGFTRQSAKLIPLNRGEALPLYLLAAFVYPRLSFRARENLETLARVVLFKKAASPIAAPGHPLSAVPINPGEAFELLVFGGYIKVSLASSPRDDPDAIAVVFFYVLVSFRAADFRISHRQRLSMRFRDGWAPSINRGISPSLVRPVTLERRRLLPSRKRYKRLTQIITRCWLAMAVGQSREQRDKKESGPTGSHF